MMDDRWVWEESIELGLGLFVGLGRGGGGDSGYQCFPSLMGTIVGGYEKKTKKNVKTEA